MAAPRSLIHKLAVLVKCDQPYNKGVFANCSVTERHGALLDSYQEDVLWLQVFMALPAQHREFEPSSKRRRENLPIDTD